MSQTATRADRVRRLLPRALVLALTLMAVILVYAAARADSDGQGSAVEPLLPSIEGSQSSEPAAMTEKDA